MGLFALFFGGLFWSPVLIVAALVLVVLIVVGVCAGPERQAPHN